MKLLFLVAAASLWLAVCVHAAPERSTIESQPEKCDPSYDSETSSTPSISTTTQSDLSGTPKKGLFGSLGRFVSDVAKGVNNVTDKVQSTTAKVVCNENKSTNESVDTVPGDVAIRTEVDCYEELGCFSNSFPWLSLLRPFRKPMKPQDIDTKIYLYTTTKSNERFTVPLWKSVSLNGSDFDPKRPYTAFITHGFASNGNTTWVSDLKDAYLKKRDANIFIVDWGKGASTFNYLQVAANTRIVGAELARFVKHLVEKEGLDPSKVHAMGHSLGAHITAYMAKVITPKIAQLTAFDPAQPGFEGNPDPVRLTKNDAEFVDVVHTNTRPFIPLLGFGLILPTGHADYYMNGGLIQPGCVLPPVDQVKIEGIGDLVKYPVEVISEWVSCSHGKSYLYYTEAILNDDCTFWGRYEGTIGSTASILSLGTSGKFLGKLFDCNLEQCSPIGLEVMEYPARGVFTASSHGSSPYCYDDPKVTKSMKEQRAFKIEMEKPGETGKSNSTISKVLGSIVDKLM